MGRDDALGLGYQPVLADGFLVHVVRQDDGFHVVVAGELDICTSPALERQVDVFVDPSSTIVIDLRDVSFIDTLGIRALWMIRERVTAAGGHLFLKSPSPAVRDLLQATRMTTVFDFAAKAKTQALASVPAAGSGRVRSPRRV